MEIRISLTKESIRPILLWGIYILFFLFCLSLAMESYAEYEYITGNIFSAITAAVGFLGVGTYFFLRTRRK